MRKHELRVHIVDKQDLSVFDVFVILAPHSNTRIQVFLLRLAGIKV